MARYKLYDEQDAFVPVFRSASNNAWIGVIVVRLSTACFRKEQINAGSSVNLDVKLLCNPPQFLVENSK